MVFLRRLRLKFTPPSRPRSPSATPTRKCRGCRRRSQQPPSRSSPSVQGGGRPKAPQTKRTPDTSPSGSTRRDQTARLPGSSGAAWH
eukprot:6047083-Pyramimonas_sp.AAC.1